MQFMILYALLLMLFIVELNTKPPSSTLFVVVEKFIIER